MRSPGEACGVPVAVVRSPGEARGVPVAVVRSPGEARGVPVAVVQQPRGVVPQAGLSRSKVVPQQQPARPQLQREVVTSRLC